MAYEGENVIDEIVPISVFTDDINPDWQNEDMRTIDYNADDVDVKIQEYWEGVKNV